MNEKQWNDLPPKKRKKILEEINIPIAWVEMQSKKDWGDLQPMCREKLKEEGRDYADITDFSKSEEERGFRFDITEDQGLTEEEKRESREMIRAMTRDMGEGFESVMKEIVKDMPTPTKKEIRKLKEGREELERNLARSLSLEAVKENLKNLEEWEKKYGIILDEASKKFCRESQDILKSVIKERGGVPIKTTPKSEKYLLKEWKKGIYHGQYARMLEKTIKKMEQCIASPAKCTMTHDDLNEFIDAHDFSKKLKKGKKAKKLGRIIKHVKQRIERIKKELEDELMFESWRGEYASEYEPAPYKPVGLKKDVPDVDYNPDVDYTKDLFTDEEEEKKEKDSEEEDEEEEDVFGKFVSPSYADIKEFEEETGKEAIEYGKTTDEFREWKKKKMEEEMTFIDF